MIIVYFDDLILYREYHGPASLFMVSGTIPSTSEPCRTMMAESIACYYNDTTSSIRRRELNIWKKNIYLYYSHFTQYYWFNYLFTIISLIYQNKNNDSKKLPFAYNLPWLCYFTSVINKIHWWNKEHCI